MVIQLAIFRQRWQQARLAIMVLTADEAAARSLFQLFGVNLRMAGSASGKVRH